jgi:hypothetical protein
MLTMHLKMHPVFKKCGMQQAAQAMAVVILHNVALLPKRAVRNGIAGLVTSGIDA